MGQLPRGVSKQRCELFYCIPRRALFTTPPPFYREPKSLLLLEHFFITFLAFPSCSLGNLWKSANGTSPFSEAHSLGGSYPRGHCHATHATTTRPPPPRSTAQRFNIQPLARGGCSPHLPPLVHSDGHGAKPHGRPRAPSLSTPAPRREAAAAVRPIQNPIPFAPAPSTFQTPQLNLEPQATNPIP